jgi:hypothetical protein
MLAHFRSSYQQKKKHLHIVGIKIILRKLRQNANHPEGRLLCELKRQESKKGEKDCILSKAKKDQ